MPAPFGNYVLDRWLAQGGMANVFVATYSRPLGFEREVALKVIKPEYAHHPGFITMFLDEARLAARLTHPNIVQVHDLGQVQGHFFIAMEYVHGPSLSTALARAQAQGRRMAPGVAVLLVEALLEALRYAHQRRDRDGQGLALVHRDVSPQNILLGFDGQVKLADFGVAKANMNLHRTRSGVIKGKYSHMAPEQCLGQPIDARADLFAVGIIFYELLTGRPLFVRPTLYETMKALLEQPILPPSQVNPAAPAELDALVLKALSRDPAGRFLSAHAFLEALKLVSRRLEIHSDREDLQAFLDVVYKRSRNNLAGEELPGVPVTADSLSMILDGVDSTAGDDDSGELDVLTLEPSRSGPAVRSSGDEGRPQQEKTPVREAPAPAEGTGRKEPPATMVLPRRGAAVQVGDAPTMVLNRPADERQPAFEEVTPFDPPMMYSSNRAVTAKPAPPTPIYEAATLVDRRSPEGVGPARQPAVRPPEPEVVRAALAAHRSATAALQAPTIPSAPAAHRSAAPAPAASPALTARYATSPLQAATVPLSPAARPSAAAPWTADGQSASAPGHRSGIIPPDAPIRPASAVRALTGGPPPRPVYNGLPPIQPLPEGAPAIPDTVIGRETTNAWGELEIERTNQWGEIELDDTDAWG